MKIVLDFDDTVFNTHQMMGDFVKISEKAGFTEDEFWTAYQKCKEKVKDLDIKVLADLLYKDIIRTTPLLKKEEIIKGWNSVLVKADNFIYHDFFDLADSFDKKDLTLLSFGATEFQKEKIERSKIDSLLNEIIITKADKVNDFKNITQKYGDEKIFFIEDKADQIDQIKKEFPQIITFKMERSQGGHIKTRSELTDYIVKDLDEVRKIIFNANK